MNETKDKYLEWHELYQKFKILKQKEATMRRELCEEIFEKHEAITGDPDFKTATITSSSGLKVTATKKINQSIDEAVLSSIYKELSDSEHQALTFKPKLVAKFFNQLPDDCLLMQAITEKPGMPTLKIKV